MDKTFVIPNKEQEANNWIAMGNASTLGKLLDKINFEDPNKDQAYQLTKDLFDANIRIDYIQGYMDNQKVAHYIFAFLGTGSKDKDQIYIQDFLSNLNDLLDWEGTTTLTYIEGNTFIGTFNI